MSEPELYLYDDETARGWQPFALTRPVGELMLGAYTMRSRAERLFRAHCVGHITSPHLLGFEEPGSAAVVDAARVRAKRARVFVNARVLLDWQEIALPESAAVLMVGDDIAGCYLPAGAATPAAAWFERPTADHPGVVRLKGRLLRHVWELVAENPAQIRRDFDAARAAGGIEDVERGGQFQAIGYRAGLLRLGAGVTIEPNVVLDFSEGPIWLDDGVTVRAFTRLAGPAYVGRRSTLLGGPYVAISIGPMCKVHGELEESVVLGYSNKAHDGFIGHAYLGRWVNLGAMSTNSDLKNNYGRIRMWTPAGDVDTGLIKLGSLLGDHVKTGIGALLNTGTVIGAGSNLYGTEMPPKYVPPFSWGSGSELVAFDVDRFLGVAETVMKRRDLTLSEGMRGMLRRAWQIGREQT